MSKKPAKGSERPRAWLYGVVNPLIEGLEREKKLLDRGNLTWRFRSRLPEYIAEPAQYLSSSGRPNLRDLLKFYPDFGNRLEQHANLLAEAIVAAKDAHERLIATPRFLSAVRDAAREWRAAFPEIPHPFWENDHVLASLAAERLVNEITNLEDHYVNSKYWSIAQGHLKEFRGLPEMLELRRKRSELLEDTKSLLADANKLQDTLCDEYDLPPAPYQSLPA